MRRATRLMVGIVIALFGLSAAPYAEAQGRGRGGEGGGRGGFGDRDDRGGRGGRDDRGGTRPRAAPEFDPAAAGAIATLLAGAGVISARRKR